MYIQLIVVGEQFNHLTPIGGELLRVHLITCGLIVQQLGKLLRVHLITCGLIVQQLSPIGFNHLNPIGDTVDEG